MNSPYRLEEQGNDLKVTISNTGVKGDYALLNAVAGFNNSRAGKIIALLLLSGKQLSDITGLGSAEEIPQMISGSGEVSFVVKNMNKQNFGDTHSSWRDMNAQFSRYVDALNQTLGNLQVSGLGLRYSSSRNQITPTFEVEGSNTAKESFAEKFSNFDIPVSMTTKAGHAYLDIDPEANVNYIPGFRDMVGMHDAGIFKRTEEGRIERQ